MASEGMLKCFSREAAADLSALQFTFVIIDGNGKVAANTTAGGHVVGVLQNKPTSGQTAVVAYSGISKIKAGATITADDLIQSTNAGAADVAVGAAEPGNFVPGHALSGGASGDIIDMLLAASGWLTS